MSNIKWGAVEQVMGVYAKLIDLGPPEAHGMIACPLGTSPASFPPPFPIVATAAPIQVGVEDEDGTVCDVYAWVSQEAWDRLAS